MDNVGQNPHSTTTQGCNMGSNHHITTTLGYDINHTSGDHRHPKASEGGCYYTKDNKTNPGKSHTPQVTNYATQSHRELPQTTDLYQYPIIHSMPNIRNGEHRANGSIQSNGSVVHHPGIAAPAHYHPTQETGRILTSRF